jgi:hypothetical protein
MDTKLHTIETLIDDLREGVDLTAVVQDLAENHRRLLAKWAGLCMGVVADDVEQAVNRLSKTFPHHAHMFEDVLLLMRGVTPKIVACDYVGSTKRYGRMAEMMYWAMYGYSEFCNASARKNGQTIPVGDGQALSTLISAMNAFTSALRMVRYATREEKPEACAKLAREACPAFIRNIGQARDSAAHVISVEKGTVYKGAFYEEDGRVKVLSVGPAAQELLDWSRTTLRHLLAEELLVEATSPDLHLEV